MVLMAKSGIKKVQKKGYESDYYWNVKTNTGIDTGVIGSSAKIVSKFIPYATFKIDILDPKGAKVKQFQFKASAPEKITNKAYFGNRFDKLDANMIDRLIELLKPYIEQSVEEVFKQV